MKQRLSDSLRGVAKGVIKPVPQRDAMKASFLTTVYETLAVHRRPEI